MTDTRIFPLLAIMSLTLASCVETIDLDPHDGGSLVVNCVLTEDDTQTLELYYTAALSEGTFAPVEGAKAALIHNGDTVARFSQSDDGLWRAAYRPEYGETYILDVEADGHELSASTTFPCDFEMGTYIVEMNTGIVPSDTRDFAHCFHVNFHHDYSSQAYKNDLYLWAFPKDKGWGDDFQRNIATDLLCADNFNVTPLSVRDWPCFSPDSVAAMASSKNMLTWIPEHCGDYVTHDGFVRLAIPPRYAYKLPSFMDLVKDNNHSFILVRDFPPNNNGLDDYQGQVHYDGFGSLYDFYLLSEEADNYFKEVYRKRLNKDNFVFEFDRENIYTNVQGGLGVFGAMLLRENGPGLGTWALN